MSTYSSYNSIIERYIANESEAFFNPDMKAQAINDTIQELLEEYQTLSNYNRVLCKNK
jgi:hypothetical protein